MENAELDKLIACLDCDLLIERISLIENQQAHCPRCNNILYQGRRDHVLKTLIVSGSGLLMVFPAYYLPIMNMGALGITNATSVLTSIPPMMNSSFWIAGIALLLFAVIFPILILSLSFFISIHLWFSICPVYLCELQKLYQRLIRWGMAEVYVLGLLVAFIKLTDDFTVALGSGMLCFILMMFCSLLVTTTVSRQYFWETLYYAKNHQ
ncbi:MAG: paraquat-inducible protein A [Enterobacterales bacterium]|jgi:paraquat-inducible protein A